MRSGRAPVQAGDLSALLGNAVISKQSQNARSACFQGEQDSPNPGRFVPNGQHHRPMGATDPIRRSSGRDGRGALSQSDAQLTLARKTQRIIQNISTC